MARKKKHPEHINHERWLVSYADFITLLFAFFVVMFAVSQVDSNRVGRFSEAFTRAMGMDIWPMPGSGIFQGMPMINGEPRPGAGVGQGTGSGDDGYLPPELDATHRSLAESVRDGNLEGLQVVRRRGELVLRLPDGIVFESGSADVKPEAIGILNLVAMEIRARALDVRVEGHTDNRPVRGNSRFHSNWELSTSRAVAVLRVLNEGGLDPTRLAVAGYGEFRPIAGNETDEGRRQNRRVDLVLSITPPRVRERIDSDAGALTEGDAEVSFTVDASALSAGDAEAVSADASALSTGDAEAAHGDAHEAHAAASADPHAAPHADPPAAPAAH